MLSDHWQSEVLELEELIDGIVDPAAFCQVCATSMMELRIEWTQELHATFSSESIVFSSSFYNTEG